MKRSMENQNENPRKFYVRVHAKFNTKGEITPFAMKWNGKFLPVEKVVRVEEKSPFSSGNPLENCFTVIIEGQEKHLYFEKPNPLFKTDAVGRWYVLGNVSKSKKDKQ